MIKIPTWLSTSLIILISLIWAGNFVAGLVVKDYQAPESVNLLFSSVIGAILIVRKGDGDGKGTSKDDAEAKK